MSTTTTARKPAAARTAKAAATTAPPSSGKITEDIRLRVNAIIGEQQAIIKQRHDVIRGFWIARIAQQHLLMVGPGGTAKSFLQRDAVSHIADAVRFEVALDETTDPGQVFGPPDIPAMVKEGKNRRVITGMLPEATDAFIDEVFNGNSPVLHGLMPIMNEHIFHNNGMPMDVPLRTAVAGTNKLNADVDLAAFWDRWHHRHVVDYIDSRTDRADMVAGAVARMATLGRGTGTSLAKTKTMVTVAELDQAFNEALALDVDDAVWELFLDIVDELKREGVQVSDRRQPEGMVAVLANAWIRGHDTVKASDLDVLAHMWWLTQDQRGTVRDIVLKVANPGEKAAMDLAKDFREIESNLLNAQQGGTDTEKLRRLGVELIRNCDKLLKDAGEISKTATAAGADTAKLDDLVDRVNTFKRRVGLEIFRITPEKAEQIAKA